MNNSGQKTRSTNHSAHCLLIFHSCLSTWMLVLLLLCTSLISAQKAIFERIGLEEGLLQNHVTTLFQDTRGSIWVGTSDGLYRYDGYDFKAFRFDPLDPTSISGNYIHGILEDHTGIFWVRTSGGGVDIYDPVTTKFTHLRFNADNPQSLSDDNVSAIIEDKSGNIWIATNGGGLNIYDRETSNFVHVKQNPVQYSSLSSNLISTIFEDSNGHIWVGTNGGGLNRLSGSEPYLASRLLREASSQNNSALLMTQFEHYYAQGPTYPTTLIRDIENLVKKDRRVAQISQPGNYQDTTLTFSLDETTTFLVVGMGDGNSYGMLDYGWIESEDSQQVFWAMDYEESRHAGGATRNRLQIATVRLKPATYRLRFRSDGHHSYDNWVTDTPGKIDLWGIQLLALRQAEVRRFQQQLRIKIQPNSLPHNRITAIVEDQRNQIWVGTADGLTLLEENETGPLSFRVFRADSRDPSTLNHSFVEQLYVDPNDQTLWIRSAVSGLNELNINDFSIKQHFGDPSAYTISSILRSSDNSLWIGASEALIHLENRGHTDRPSIYMHQPGNISSLSSDNITCLMQDRSANLWIGTERGGLNKLSRRQQNFHHYRRMADDEQSLSGNDVTAILEARDGAIWVGTSENGLNRLDPIEDPVKRFSYTHFRWEPGNPQTIPYNHISALYQDRSGGIWIGTFGGGLSSYDPPSGQFKHYRHQRYTTNSLTSDYVNTISEDQYGQIWIGTRAGLTKLDKFSGRFIQYRHEAQDPNSLSSDDVWSIYEDFHGNGRTLWIGTRTGGLNRFNRDTQKFTRYIRDFDDPTSLNNQAILSIYQDKAGNLWFGTYSGGLNKFNRESEEFTYFTERNGLVSNMILGILEDHHGNLWLSTNKGISKFNPASADEQKRPDVRNYDVTDGLQANQFNAGAFAVTNDGEMFFGGINGMNSFYPDSVKDNPYLPPVQITAFSVLNERADELLARAVYRNEPIELSYNQNFISFEFASLDYTNPAKNRYAFRLTNVDEDWVQSGTRRFRSYTDLDPGEYTFAVRGSNNDGRWSTDVASVSIIVHPPFYKTWWFYLCGALFIVTAATVLHKYRLRYKLNRIMEIEQVRLKESERVRTKAARDFHDELGHKLTKISLFTEIAKRNLENANNDVTDYLERINHTAKGLAGGMRDFIWTLNPEKDSLHEVAMRLKDFGDGLFDKTGIAFRTKGVNNDLEEISLTMDSRRHLTLIFKEAMNNALKHAECENAVLTFKVEPTHFTVMLSDDGKGLPAEPAENGAASNGANGHRPYQPSGNGLNNMQLRARKISGSLTLKGHKNDGTSVIFSAEMPQKGN